MSALSWTWAFDADLGYLNTIYKRLRVTHLMFWPKHPAHAFAEGNKVPSEDPYPIGSPMVCPKAEHPDMQFVQMLRGFYCQGQTWMFEVGSVTAEGYMGERTVSMYAPLHAKC
jgi:hypothetical protein